MSGDAVHAFQFSTEFPFVPAEVCTSRSATKEDSRHQEEADQAPGQLLHDVALIAWGGRIAYCIG